MHIGDDDLEHYHLGAVFGSELGIIEEHILSCAECAERAMEIGEYVDAMRAAMARMKPPISSAGS